MGDAAGESGGASVPLCEGPEAELGKEEIPVPSRPYLPAVLSAEEITPVLDLATNLKHWTGMALFYMPMESAWTENFETMFHTDLMFPNTKDATLS